PYVSRCAALACYPCCFSPTSLPALLASTMLFRSPLAALHVRQQPRVLRGIGAAELVVGAHHRPVLGGDVLLQQARRHLCLSAPVAADGRAAQRVEIGRASWRQVVLVTM